MQYNFKDIAKHYLNVILPSDKFLSPNPVKDIDLLYPPFAALQLELNQTALNTLTYGFRLTESYRSNALQKAYYNSGLSKIPANGMHHYGIAADTIFIRLCEATYKGDFKKLHELYEQLGGPDLGTLEIWDAGHFQYIPVSMQGELRLVVGNAVRDFQRDFGLTIDGIAGPKTHARAIEVIKTGTVIEP